MSTASKLPMGIVEEIVDAAVALANMPGNTTNCLTPRQRHVLELAEHAADEEGEPTDLNFGDLGLDLDRYR